MFKLFQLVEQKFQICSFFDFECPCFKFAMKTSNKPPLF